MSSVRLSLRGLRLNLENFVRTEKVIRVDMNKRLVSSFLSLVLAVAPIFSRVAVGAESSGSAAAGQAGTATTELSLIHI